MRIPIALILVAVLCLSTGGPAYAEWVRVGDNVLGTRYADPNTIQGKGKLVKMWAVLDFKTAQDGMNGVSFLSEKTQFEYDCAEERMRVLAFVWFSGHMGQGKVVFSNSDEDLKEWGPVGKPGGNHHALWKLACGKK